MEIQRATPGDAEALSKVAFAAKRHWGYPEHWMERWRESLTITPEFVGRNEVYAATLNEEILGFYALAGEEDRKSTRLNSSHANISYAVFCLKNKKTLIK